MKVPTSSLLLYKFLQYLPFKIRANTINKHTLFSTGKPGIREIINQYVRLKQK